MTETTTRLDALESELAELLPEDGVSRDRRTRERLAVDGGWMSPIISEKLPFTIPDLAAFPTDAAQIGEVVAAAVRRGVAVTPRGKGTGNYGQAIPMSGGLVLSTSRARAVVGVGDGWIMAEAGAPMVALESAAQATGQQLWMYPSTVRSTVGGFLSGGSGGTGSIAHGTNDMGFVAALDVVFADGSSRLHHVEGAEAQRWVHNYGTAGIIARATVRLEPLQDWRCLYASFAEFGGALSTLRALGRLDPLPRLTSADPPTLAKTLPQDPAGDRGRSSLRAMVDERALGAAVAIVENAGGKVEQVRSGAQAQLKMSMLSYNHPITWLQRSRPGAYFHVEVGGDALIDRIDEVHAVYPGGLLHVELGHRAPIGMLAGEYRDPGQVLDGIEALEALGVSVHNPHQWNVDFELARTVELAKVTDPRGLLNPGKLNPDYAGATKGAIQ
jgi:FAD/FMN-containing dehydrogenase